MTATPDNSYISTAAGKIRVLKVTIIDDTGAFQTVNQQVVSLADEDGTPIAFGDQLSALLDISHQLSVLRRGLADATGSLTFLRPGD